MKILLIYDYLSEIGGVERVMATHARWLQKAGHDVRLLFNHVDEKSAKYDFFKGLKIEEISAVKGNEAAKLIFSLLGLNKIKEYEPDLIICYSFLSIFISRKLKCKKAFYYLPLEFIYFPMKKRWEWANDLKRKIAFFGSFFLAPIFKKLDKKLIKNKLVIANSKFTRREIKERYGMESIISYPPLNNIFKPKGDYNKTLKKYHIKKKFIMTAGRIIPDKKTALAVRMFSELGNNMDLVVAGSIDKNYKKELMRLAEKLGIKDRVKILGVVSQNELIDLYSAAEIFAFASPKEAFGLVPIEAMACGTPVIAWNDNAGPNEYVINSVNGYLAKPYNLKDFREKVEKIINSNFKKKNKNKIINSVRKFSEKKLSKEFLKRINDYLTR